MDEKQTSGEVTKYKGSCHCGAVQFRAEVDLSQGTSRCNCSICTKTSWQGSIMKPEAFTLVQGEEHLGMYEFGGKTGQRFFCKNCGIHCYGKGYLEQVGGHYVSINVNCLDGVELRDLKLIYWDGRHDNWQAGPRETPWPILSSLV